ncbi:ACT domain-containing protein, partial [Candidatus Bipolaricaulota bacterium]|nr:ACT domain-containing protein [Candidatus Bipolaricaulota bacterium]
EINPEGMPCDSLEEVIRLVEKGHAPLGIIPVENSIGGYVDQSYSLIAKGDVYVVGEVYSRVRHSLLGNKGSELPEIETVYSHPQALKQCRDVLLDMKVETHATYDTAGSAKMVAEKGDKSIAAIASRYAGDKYGLEVLMEDIQSSDRNNTRFLLISSEEEGNRVKGQCHKTTVTFDLGDSPGSLHKCLKPFAENNVNLTMIRSRPTASGEWGYHFDLELEGHRSDKQVRTALKKLANIVPDCDVLGSYPQGRRI